MVARAIVAASQRSGSWVRTTLLVLAGFLFQPQLSHAVCPPEFRVPGLHEHLARLESLWREDREAARAYGYQKRIDLEVDRVQVSARLKSGGLTGKELRRLRSWDARVVVNLSSSLEVWVPVARLREFAEFDHVRLVEPPRRPFAQNLFRKEGSSGGAMSFRSLGACQKGVQEFVGEGVEVTGAGAFHEVGLCGQDATVAVIDLSFDRTIELSGAGEFGPGVGKIDPGCTKDYSTGQTGIGAIDYLGNKTHGTEVALVVHDMAPEARLCLKLVATVGQWKLAVTDASAEGADIVNLSIAFLGTSFYDGSSEVSQLVADLSSEMLFVAAAGNFREEHWQGVFESSDGELLEFTVGDESNLGEGVYTAGDRLTANLVWDNFPETAIDYDLFLLPEVLCGDDLDVATVLAAATPESSSQNCQDGSEGSNRPEESIDFTIPAGGEEGRYCVVVRKPVGGPNAELSLFLYSPDEPFVPEYRSTLRTVVDPAVEQSALSVAAVPAAVWEDGVTAWYSSTGPRNTSSHSQLLLLKPDVAGPSEVSVQAGDEFGGTSSAAPHVAGCAALLVGPSGSAYEDSEALRSWLEFGALSDVGSPGHLGGKDNFLGFGRLSCLNGGPTCADDDFEHVLDDSCAEPRQIDLGRSEIHAHCDEDWVAFYGLSGVEYELEAFNLQGGADPVLEVYSEGCEDHYPSGAESGTRGGSFRLFTPPETGIYAVRVLERDESYRSGLSYELEVRCSACVDLVASVVSSQSPVEVGEIFSYLATIWNQSPFPVASPSLEVTLDPILSLIATSDGDSCSSEPPGVVCAWDEIAAGEERVVSIQVEGSAAGTAYTEISVQSSSPDAVPSDNEAMSEVPVVDPEVSIESAITAEPQLAGDYFGRFISLDGDRAVVSAENRGDGSVFIYERATGGWALNQELAPSDLDFDAQFGAGVSIDGDVLAVGAYGADEVGANSGVVYVYRLIEGEWQREDRVVGSATDAGDLFGLSVDLKGDMLVVGSHIESVDGIQSGAAYVFRHIAGEWLQEARLLASDGQYDDRFGASVASNGVDTVFVGAWGHDQADSQAGAVYVYSKTGSEWAEGQILLPSQDTSYASFGTDLALVDERLFVGAPGPGNPLNLGLVHLYERSGGGPWQFEDAVGVSNVSPAGAFGLNIDAHGDDLVVGCIYCEPHFEVTGAAYFFEAGKEGFEETVRSPLEAVPAGEQIGGDVAISEGWGFVGAYRADSGAGKVYVYALWMENPRLTITGPIESPAYVVGDSELVEWATFNLQAEELMSLEMKRDGASSVLNSPDGVDWIGLATSVQNDGSEPIQIPGGVTLSDDWRFYVRHPDSDSYDSTDFTFEVIEIPEMDLSVQISDAPDPVVLDGQVTIQTDVSNAGPDGATAVEATIDLPVELIFDSAPAECVESANVVTCTVGALASGGSVQLPIVAIAAALGTHATSASVSGLETDTDPSNNTASESTTVVAPMTDLAVSLTDSPDPVGLGNEVALTLSLSNLGPDQATQVVGTVVLPAELPFLNGDPRCSEDSGTVTCSLPDLPAGAVEEFVVSVAASALGTFSTIASVTGTEIDTDPSNNSVVEETTVLSLVIFADGFESGDTSAWSSVVQ